MDFWTATTIIIAVFMLPSIIAAVRKPYEPQVIKNIKKLEEKQNKAKNLIK